MKEDKTTERLHKFVETANQEEQYTILDSEGVKIVARSIAEAWEEVDKIIILIMHAHAIPRNCAHKHSGKQMPVFQESLSAAN